MFPVEKTFHIKFAFSQAAQPRKLLQDDASLPVGTALGVFYSLLVTEKCLSEADPSVVQSSGQRDEDANMGILRVPVWVMAGPSWLTVCLPWVCFLWGSGLVPEPKSQMEENRKRGL